MALVTPTSTAVSYGAGDYLSDDDTTMMLYEQGYEVCRIPTPQRGVRMHTPSPSRRTNSFRASPGRRATPSPTGRKKNRLMTPIRALSFRRKKKNLVPPGPDSEAASIIRRTQWEEERERIKEEERKKKLFDFEIGSSCLSLSCQCWGGSLLVADEDDYY